MLPGTLEGLLWRLQAQSALYICGAGASAPTVPFAPALMRQVARDWIDLGSYPVEEAPWSLLTGRVYAAAAGINYFPERELRPGTEDFPSDEILRRLDEHGGRASLMRQLSIPRSQRLPLLNYTVFRAFRPGLIMNYNLDGLAMDLCGRHHRIVHVHGTVDPFLGLPDGGELVRLAQEYTIELPHDGLVLCGPEAFADADLHCRLQVMQRFAPAFVAIIGYTFGRTAEGHDDSVSLEVFANRFRDQAIDIFVLDPQPYELAAILSDSLRSHRVHPIAVYWNVLAEALRQTLSGRASSGSLHDLHRRIMDRHGPGARFPIAAR